MMTVWEANSEGLGKSINLNIIFEPYYLCVWGYRKLTNEDYRIKLASTLPHYYITVNIAKVGDLGFCVWTPVCC